MPQQNAGLPKRRMENIHYNIQALLELANQRKEQLIIMTIDFEKGFDKIFHHFIFKILEKLKIGNKNLGFMKLLYNNIFSKIEINGDHTSKIKIKRGIRQGCPLNMLIFITCTDLLTKKIQKNEQIKGVKFQNFYFKIAQYADDTTFAFQKYKEIEDILNPFMPGVLHIGQLTIKSFLLITDDRKLKKELLLIVNHSVLFPKTSFSCRLDIARRGCHTGALKYCTFFSLPGKAWSHPKGKLCQMLE